MADHGGRGDRAFFRPTHLHAAPRTCVELGARGATGRNGRVALVLRAKGTGEGDRVRFPPDAVPPARTSTPRSCRPRVALGLAVLLAACGADPARPDDAGQGADGGPFPGTTAHDGGPDAGHPVSDAGWPLSGIGISAMSSVSMRAADTSRGDFSSTVTVRAGAQAVEAELVSLRPEGEVPANMTWMPGSRAHVLATPDAGVPAAVRLVVVLDGGTLDVTREMVQLAPVRWSWDAGSPLRVVVGPSTCTFCKVCLLENGACKKWQFFTPDGGEGEVTFSESELGAGTTVSVIAEQTAQLPLDSRFTTHVDRWAPFR